MDKIPIIRPIPNVFEDFKNEEYQSSVETSENTSTKRVTSQHGTLVYITEHVFYPDEGILMKYKDIPYLRQGFVFPEAMDAISNLKRVTVLFLGTLKGNGQGWIKGRIGAFLAHYCWIAQWMFQWYDPNSNKMRRITLAPNRYRRSVRELIKLINSFLENLGIKVWTAQTGLQDFGTTSCTMIEYDNAYHWRMEDIFGIINWQAFLKNPRKEIKRVVIIYKQREKAGIEFKVETIAKALNYLLLIPSVKKALIKAVRSIDVENLKMTDYMPQENQLAINDHYYTMIYDGYDFQGKDIEERKKIWLEMTGGKIPERVYVPQQ